MADVMDSGMRYASNGKGNLGVALGAIGTGLGVLAPHMGGFFGLGNSCGYVSKESFDLQKTISSQESEIALLKSEQNTEVKIADVYERLEKQVLDLERAQNNKWAEQGVINAQITANLSVMQNQIAVLNGLTKTVIPIGNVCPEPMPLKNSWTAPTT